ncbi:hypothetical protein Tco_0236789 [Tanacetum coccineum]
MCVRSPLMNLQPSRFRLQQLGTIRVNSGKRSVYYWNIYSSQVIMHMPLDLRFSLTMSTKSKAAPNIVQVANPLLDFSISQPLDMKTYNLLSITPEVKEPTIAFSPLKFKGYTSMNSAKTRARSLHVPSVIPVRTVASISIGGVSQKSLVNHCLDGFWSHVVWVGVVNRGVPVRWVTRMYTHDHDGSEAPDELHDSILSSEPKPFKKHRPPPPLSILSHGDIYRADKPIIYPLTSGRSSSGTLLTSRILSPIEWHKYNLVTGRAVDSESVIPTGPTGGDDGSKGDECAGGAMHLAVRSFYRGVVNRRIRWVMVMEALDPHGGKTAHQQEQQ